MIQAQFYFKKTVSLFCNNNKKRSTPQLDSFYGGRQDLTAALGFERDGQTVILFRRKLNSSDEADHIIGADPMQVIWARGQEHGKYVHSPPSGLEKESASIADFYKADELKYHGKGDQRGVTVITFIGRLPRNSHGLSTKIRQNFHASAYF